MINTTNTQPRRRRSIGYAVILACSLGLMGCGVTAQGLAPGLGDSQAVRQDIGAVRLTLRSDYQTMATKADVKQLRVTLSGGALSAPVSRTVAYPTSGDVAFDALAPGTVALKVEALGATGSVLGSTTKTGIEVLAGQLTSVSVSLKLQPTQGTSPGAGKINVGIIIEDGDIITTPLPTPTPAPTPAPTTAPTPGSATYGVKPNYAPAYDVKVAVGTLNQALLSKYADGTRFALEPGVHRLGAPLSPKSSQQILGLPGAIISGSKLLSGWTQDGARWYVGSQTQRLAGNSGESVGDNPMAGKSEDTFFDDKPLKQVDSLAGVTAGTFYFDYTNSRVYIGDNPSGHKVETTVTAQAFKGGGTNVVLKNLVVEKFGNGAQSANAAINNGGLTGWLVEDCEVRYNHGMGVSIGDGGTVRGSKIHHQGQLGIGGGGGNIVVEGNEISYNNYEGFNSYWEAGGSKWVYTTNLIVRKNWAHHNYGPGLWTDIDNKGVLYEDNIVEANERSGIFHEISYSAIIRRNTLRGNGTNYKYWEPEGAGLYIANSTDVEAYGNTIEDNAGGIIMVHATDRNRDTKNNHIHDNTVRMRKGYTGIVLAGPANSAADVVFTGNNNRFVANKYYVSNTADKRWNWKGTTRSFTEWKGLGQDTAGTVTAY